MNLKLGCRVPDNQSYYSFYEYMVVWKCNIGSKLKKSGVENMQKICGLAESAASYSLVE